MRATVTQLNAGELDSAWPELIAHTNRARAELVLLPEMPFSHWLAASDDVDPTAWDEAATAHDAWIDRLHELGATVVVGSRPIVEAGHRYNEGFVWADGVVEPWHRKTYLPDEPGFWEATWYERGPVEFTTKASAFGDLGIQICTEMWFFEHARDYGTRGVRLIVTPRATERATIPKWTAGGQVSAVSAGAYSLSSNHSGSYRDVAMGGAGWVISPDGVILATTSGSEPFVTVDLDLEAADRAKDTYPRYVDSGPV